MEEFYLYDKQDLADSKKLSNSITDEAEDNQFSGLIPFSNKKEVNSDFPNTNELNLETSQPKQVEKETLFFRFMTRTKCEISPTENKALAHNIINYFDYLKQKECYIFPEKLCDDTLPAFSKQSFQYNSGINKLEESFNSGMDSVIMNMEKLLLNHKGENNGFVENYSELDILEKNKQIYLSKNKVNFNVLVLGESGSGKTTFIKNFLKKVEKLNVKGKNNQNDISLDNNSFNVYSEQNFPINEDDIKTGINTSKFVSYKVNHLSNSHNYNFRIIDSPGYKSYSSQADWYNQIIEYINLKVRTFFIKNSEYYSYKQENNSGEKEIDYRIHLILYFISDPIPKAIDYSIMNELQKWANILPVISRGDASDYNKVVNDKSELLSNLKNNEIEIFDVYSALSKLIKNQFSINLILGGKFGFCPPFILNLPNNPQNDICLETLENTHNSDFLRLYYILACYIPFECVEKTKKHYKLFKQNILYSKDEKNSNYPNLWNLLFAVFAIPSLLSGAYLLFQKK